MGNNEEHIPPRLSQAITGPVREHIQTTLDVIQTLVEYLPEDLARHFIEVLLQKLLAKDATYWTDKKPAEHLLTTPRPRLSSEFLNLIGGDDYSGPTGPIFRIFRNGFQQNPPPYEFVLKVIPR